MKKNLVFLFVLPFVLAEILAGFLVLRLKNIQKTGLISANFGTPDWRLLILYIILFAFIFFLARRFFKPAKLFFRILFLIAMLGSFELFLMAFIPQPFIVFLLSLLLVLFFWFVRTILVHDTLIIVVFSSLAALLGLSFPPEQILIILLILSIYDYISVYKTKHMQVMAKELISWHIIPAIIIPTKLYEFLGPKKPTPPEEHNYFILGGGDIVFPISLMISLLLRSPLESFFSAISLLIGVFITYYLFISKKEAIPALPGLAFFAVLGFIIGGIVDRWIF